MRSLFTTGVDSVYGDTMPIVSIIIPVYNTSRYLEECLQSVTNQTLKDIEIICIDDHSNDDSIKILDDYSKRDGRIIVKLHDKNCGLLKTRKDGVELASGEYILFLDSDDSLKEDACKELSELMEKTNCDMIQFGTNVIPHENADRKMTSHYIQYLKTPRKKLSKESIFKYQFSGLTNWHLWNKIYKADICKKTYGSVQDRYMIVSDDLYASFFFSYYADKMMSIKKKYYCYNIGRGYTNSNIDKVKQIRTICDNSWLTCDCMDFLKNNGDYQRYGKYCFRGPLLQLDACLSILKGIDDEESIKEGFELITRCWNKDPFEKTYEECLSDNKWKRIKRHIKDFGIIDTLKVSVHMISFRIGRLLIQFSLRT